MDNRILENLNKKRFNSPELLYLTLSRVLKIVLFCLGLTFLLWFFLIQNYIWFTLLLGISLGIVAEILFNSRNRVTNGTPQNKEEFVLERKIEEQNRVGS